MNVPAETPNDELLRGAYRVARFSSANTLSDADAIILPLMAALLIAREQGVTDGTLRSAFAALIDENQPEEPVQ